MIYFVFIIIMIVFSIGYVKNVSQKEILKITMACLWALATFRSVSIGNDTINYKELFEYITLYGDYDIYIIRYEIGYLVLNDIISSFTNDFTFFIAIVNVYIYVAYYNFFKTYSANYMISVFLFFTLGYWGQTVNIIRLQLAIATCIYAVLCLDKGYLKTGKIVFFTSALFHKISIIYCLAILLRRKLSNRQCLIMLLVAGACLYTFSNMLDVVREFSVYWEQSYSNESSEYLTGEIKIASVINWIFAVIVLLFSRMVIAQNIKYIDEQKKVMLAQQVNMVYMASLILLVSFQFNLIDRCAIFFSLFETVLIPNCIVLIRSKSLRYISLVTILVTGVMYFSVVNIYRPEWNHIYPYRTFLDD